MTNSTTASSRLGGLIFASMFIACAGGANHAPPAPPVPDPGIYAKCVSDAERPHCTGYRPSLLELVIRPEWYDGGQVEVAGVLAQGLEESALYASTEDYTQMHGSSAVWLRIAKCPAGCQPLVGEWVTVTGRFRPTERGHMGMFAGTIDEAVVVKRAVARRLPPPPTESTATGEKR